jgi:hypothetical protein
MSQEERILYLEKLSKVIRYAGLNLQPQILGVVLDENVVNFVRKIDAALTANPNLDLESIDAIVAEVNAEAERKAKAAAKKAEKKTKLDKA